MHQGEWSLTGAKPLFAMLDDPHPGHGLRGVNDPDVLLDTDSGAEPWYAAGVSGPSTVLDDDVLHVFVTATHSPISWARASARMLRRRRRPPMPSPYYLTTARFTFQRTT